MARGPDEPDEPEEDEPDPPLLHIAVDPVFFVGDEVTFDASLSYDPQDLELTYEWTCSNGQTGDQNMLTFTLHDTFFMAGGKASQPP